MPCADQVVAPVWPVLRDAHRAVCSNLDDVGHGRTSPPQDPRTRLTMSTAAGTPVRFMLPSDLT
ncbi:MAG: hypothetical protein ACRDH5_16175, partial [bacterium]